MKFLTLEEVRKCCESYGIKITSNRFLKYETENPTCLSIGLEEKPSRVIALADYLVPTWDEIPFRGALLWIRSWDVWGDFSEKTASMIIQQMRLARGGTEALADRPGHQFGFAELFEMHSFFVIPLLFGWDAFLIPDGGDYFLFVSHDGVVEVVSRTPQMLDELRHRLRDWNPKTDKTWYPERVRR
jgi:hypothetical protein